MKLTIDLTKGDKLYHAENVGLSIFATGETAEKAVQEFGKHFGHFMSYYSVLKNEDVIGPAVRYKGMHNAIKDELK